jgi:hypothetical protein
LAEFSIYSLPTDRKAMRLMDQATPKSGNSDRHPNNLAMPKRSPGRPSPEAQAKYEAALKTWCKGIKDLHRERAKDPNNFEVSSRGWCYLLEEHGLPKGDFDIAQGLINDCRKSGLLPLTVCCEDERRRADNLEELDDPDPIARAAELVAYINEAEEYYYPHSFWEAQDYYIEMLVEKIDLKNLFRIECEPLHIPIINGGGWVDINARAAMMRRFQFWERKGKQCVLLPFGDLDPGGVRITDHIRSNLADLTKQVGWSPDNLIIDRFGIDIDFIRRHRVSWINNLHTSKGTYPLDDPRHNDHAKNYVQDFLRKYGARKVEATALVLPRLVPHARALCRRAILKYLSAEAPEQYQSSLELPRRKLRAEIKRLLKVVR